MILDDQARQSKPGAWGQGSVSVGHEGLLVPEAVELNSSTSQPEALTSQLFTAVSPKQRPWTSHLDEAPLLHTARAKRRDVPVGFRIRSWSELEDRLAGEELTRYSGIGDERIVGNADVTPVKLAPFLGTEIGVAERNELTVKGVVRYYAHVEGGVHFGAAKDPGEPTMMSMSQMLLGHSTGQLQVLAHLGMIVVEALEPLHRSILSEPSVHRLWHRKDERGLYSNHWTTEYFRQTER